MSGVNAHALLASCPATLPQQSTAKQPAWQQRRHAILPAPLSFIESVSWQPAARSATLACRLQSAHLSWLWGCSSLPSAVPLELGLAAVAMLGDRAASCSLQGVVLSRAGQLQLVQQASPVLLASVDMPLGQIRIASRLDRGVEGILTASAAEAGQPFMCPKPTSSAGRAWLPSLPHAADVQATACTASLASCEGPGSFCCHPAAQQAALDLRTAADRASGGNLSSASFVAAMPGHLPQALMAMRSSVGLHAESAPAAVMDGLTFGAAMPALPMLTAANSLAYAVQLQVAGTAPTCIGQPSPGEIAIFAATASTSQLICSQAVHHPAAVQVLRSCYLVPNGQLPQVPVSSSIPRPQQHGGSQQPLPLRP